MTVENYVTEIYKQYKISSNQFFVALQKLYNKLSLEYWKEDISQFLDSNENIKEYEALNTAFEFEELSNREWRAFRGAWKHANEIKHENADFSFSPEYAILCVENYNRIVKEILQDENSKDFIILKRELIASESNDGSSVAQALKEAQEQAELKAMQIQLDKQKQSNQHICPKCGSRLVIRTRRNDGHKFWGCSNYFETGCNGSEDYIDPEEIINNLKLMATYDGETQWFIAREREKGGNVRFVQNLGLPQELVKNIASNENEFEEYKRFSHWRFDYKEKRNMEVSPKLRFISSLGYKMLTRGKITCISHKVEYELNKKFGGEKNFEPEMLVNYFKENHKPSFWLDGKGNEQHFYQDLLKNVYGKNFERYVIPQIDLATLIGANEDFGDQRVDFAICDGKNRIVVELDDTMHLGHESYDNIRNELLEDAGFTVFRIPTSQAKHGSNFLHELSASIDKYHIELDDIKRNRRLIACKIIQQIEVTTIYGVMHGFFSNNEEIAITFNDHVFSNKEREFIRDLISNDINEFLNNISKLYSLETLFEIKYIEKPVQNQVIKSFKEISYDTHAKATENRVIISDFVYCRDFINNLPYYEELGEFSNDNKVVEYFMMYFFRKESFREGQFEAISNTLHHKDSVVLLPTGHGKSIAFQLACLLIPGISIVVSPLVSLMYDQVDNLRQYGIDRAKALAGGLSKESKEEMSDLLISGDSIITYISPERLQVQSFRQTLERTLVEVPIPLFVIDEAHCLSEWGHDFRTSYLNLGRIIREHCKHDNKSPIIMALTGTASDNVLSDIRNQLDIWEEGSLISPTHFDRKELHYQVVDCENEEKRSKLLEVLNNIPIVFGEEQETFYSLKGENTNSGLVFCLHVNGPYGTSNICNFLKSHYKCGMYSGSAPSGWKGKKTWDDEKAREAKAFKNNENNILVATSAYGMGIDKPNIRFTIHYNIAKSIEAFYQETGRAGRDRNDSECILLTSLNSKDQKGHDDFDRIMYFHENSYKGIDEELSNAKRLLEMLDLSKKNVKLITIGLTDIDNKDKSQYLVAMEKAIYRLLLIGVISDYTKIRKDEYSLSVNEFNKETIRLSFQECIKKYHEGRLQSEMKKINRIGEKTSINYILEVERILITFLYDNIVESRRQAMFSMKKLAESAATVEDQDIYIHSEIESYLTTSDQQEILNIVQGEKGGLRESRNFYENGDFQNLRNLRGQITRQIESYPDHPGLILSRVYIDLINCDIETDMESIDELNKGIDYAITRYSNSKSEVINHLIWLFTKLYNSNKSVALDACENLTEAFNAKDIYSIAGSITNNDEELLPFEYAVFAEISDEVVNLLKN